MPNLLPLQFKKTDVLSAKKPVFDYLQNRTVYHPDAFRQDIDNWDTLRRNTTGNTSVHVDRLRDFFAYHAQLVSISNKLPNDIGLQFSYSPAYAVGTPAITLRSIAFERASILFNLAVLYSKLAEIENRSTPEAIKRAGTYYNNAAGTFAFLISNALPKLESSYTPDEEERPLDLTVPFLKTLEYIMLAHAQECVWQRAGIEDCRDGLLAKLAKAVAQFYQHAIAAISDAPPQIRDVFPSTWLTHIRVKRSHFEAVAQYRKSRDDSTKNLYGIQVTRIAKAKEDARFGYNLARSSRIAKTVLDDVEGLLHEIEQEHTRADRENGLVYNQDIPSFASLPEIEVSIIASPKTPVELSNVKTVIGNAPLFGELLSWGALEAIRIYDSNKQTYVNDKIVRVVHELKRTTTRQLNKLNLPHSLEVLNQPVRLPPSLLKNTEQVRSEEGPSLVQRQIEEVQRLRTSVVKMLDQAMDILDDEAEDDEAFCKDLGKAKNGAGRLPSAEANVELVKQEQKFRKLIEKAERGDNAIMDLWDRWAEVIEQLTYDEETLEAAVPSSTLTSDSQSSDPAYKRTRSLSSTLKGLIESLNEINRDLAKSARLAQITAEKDDIHGQVVKAAAVFEDWTEEITPRKFSDVLDEEMMKYEEFVIEVENGAEQIERVLDKIKVKNQEFLQSRKDDPAVEEREIALQSLNLAYLKYEEIKKLLEEGFEFYNGLANIFGRFIDSCKAWSAQRKGEIQSLTLKLAAMEVSGETRYGDTRYEETRYGETQYETAPEPGPDTEPELNPEPKLEPEPEPEPASASPPAKTKIKRLSGLPPPDSREWRTIELPPPPPLTVSSGSGGRSKSSLGGVKQKKKAVRG